MSYRAFLSTVLFTSLPMAGCAAATFDPSAAEVCEAFRGSGCAPELDVAACIERTETSFAEWEAAGCIAEANASNGCSLAAMGRGECDSSLLGACEAAYAALNTCVGNAFSCDVATGTLAYCVSYRNVASRAEETCDALGGTLVASCADRGASGRCVRSVAGSEVVQHYGAPLPAGFTAAGLESSCVSIGGTWMTP